MADIDLVSMSTLANLPDALRERIVARAREDAKKLDGASADILPRASQEALLITARRSVEDELRAAALPPLVSAAERAQWDLEKRAFGKKRSLAGQGELVKAVGEAKAREIATEWNTKLGDIATRGVNPHKAELKVAKKEAKAERKKLGGDKTGDKAEKVNLSNPWKNNAPGAEAARIEIIRTVGTQRAQELARKAGVDLAGRKVAS